MSISCRVRWFFGPQSEWLWVMSMMDLLNATCDWPGHGKCLRPAQSHTIPSGILYS